VENATQNRLIAEEAQGRAHGPGAGGGVLLVPPRRHERDGIARRARCVRQVTRLFFSADILQPRLERLA
jgi:hypothetical protein